MEILEKDLLSITTGVIIHQVNNKHKMASGVAKQIREMYLQHYKDYMDNDLELGSLVKTHINNKFGIIGMVAQDGYGYDGKQYTGYEAFENCLYGIKILHDQSPTVKYYMPYNIGCCRGGGDWKVIEAMIEKICPFIILCRFNKG